MKTKNHKYTLAVDGMPKCDCYGLDNLLTRALEYTEGYQYEGAPVLRAYDWCENHTFTVDVRSGELIY